MAVPRALPVIPMPVEQAGVNARLHFAVLLVFQRLLVAGIVRAAFGEHLARENQVFPVRRKQNSARFGRQIRHLPRVRAVRIRQPDLRCAHAVRDECDVPGIGRPARPLVILPRLSDRSRCAAPDRHHVDLRDALVIGHIDCLDGEGHHPPVRRNLRIGDTRQLEQRLRVERKLLREQAGGCEKRE